MSKMTSYNAHLLWKSTLENARYITLDIKCTRLEKTYTRYSPTTSHEDVISYTFHPRGLAVPATHWVCDVNRAYRKGGSDKSYDTRDKVKLASLSVASFVKKSLAHTLLQAVIEYDGDYLRQYIDLDSICDLKIESSVSR